MRHSIKLLVLVGLIFGLSARADSLPLGNLDLNKVHQGYGRPHTDRSVDGKPLTIAGKAYTSGVGTHAGSSLWVDLHGSATRFRALVGADDEVSSPGSVRFRVIGDGKSLFDSGLVKTGEAARAVDVDLMGVATLILLVTPTEDGIDYDHADWADAVIEYSGKVPVAIRPPAEKAEILTPAPGPLPRMTGPKVFGVRPGSPILFSFTATGEKPMNFSAAGLPDGVSLDSATGRLNGTVAAAGSHSITVEAANARGKASRAFTLVVGDRLALTPPMGWNSWNCFATAVDDAKVRAAADAMVASGLADHGWTNINIDDCWEIKPDAKDGPLAGKPRDENGLINTNAKFPDMKGLADYVHGKGLRFGIYSSPGPLTCAGFTASYEFEEKDAQRYAEWGVDYLKYDWCSYGEIAKKIRAQELRPTERNVLKHPYEVMRDALRRQKRDIVYSLCQYGMGNVWEWGAEVDGNCWRTTGDIEDSWDSMAGIGFRQAGHEKFAEPGRWNDPDMLVVGKVGWGPQLHPTRLTPNEQYTHISLWAPLSSPLLIGCDMTQLDDFTKSLLTNDEVLDVSQDPLGKQAGRVAVVEETEVWARPLEDGSMAVGLFNRGEFAGDVTVKFADLKLNGKQTVRDLWRQKDQGQFDDAFTAKVPRHGVVLIKVSAIGK